MKDFLPKVIKMPIYIEVVDLKKEQERLTEIVVQFLQFISLLTKRLFGLQLQLTDCLCTCDSSINYALCKICGCHILTYMKDARRQSSPDA